MTKGSARAGLYLAAGIFLSRLLGMLRDALLSDRFAGEAVSVFLYSQRLPFSLAQLLVGGVTAILVPELAARLASGDKEQASRLARVALSYWFAGFTLLSALTMLLAKQLAFLVAPELPAAEMDATAAMLRQLAWLTFFNGMGGLLFAVLQATERFTPLAIAQLMPNIAIVLALMFFAEPLGITSAAVGTLVGGVLYCLILLIFWRGTGLTFRFCFRDEGVDFWRLTALTVPLILVMAGFDLGSWAQGVLASGSEGSRYDLLSYAYRIAELPFGIFVIAIFTVLFPQLARSAGEEDVAKLKHQVGSATRVSLFLIMPAAALLIALAGPVVRFLLQHGEFGPEEGRITTLLVQCLAGWMIARSLLQLALAVYLALEEILVLFLGQVAGVALIFFFGYLMRPFGLWGLALGGTLAGAFEVVGLGLWLRHKHGTWGIRRVVTSGLIFLVPSALLGVAASMTHALLANQLGAGLRGQALALVAATIVGLLVYLFFAWLMRLPELKLLGGSLRQRLAKSEESAQ